MRVLGFAGTRVTDAGFAALEHMTKLSELHLSFYGTGLDGFTGSGLKYLANKPLLVELDLRGDGIQNEELVHLNGLPQLKKLTLPSSITDEGMVHLEPLVNLEELIVSESA